MHGIQQHTAVQDAIYTLSRRGLHGIITQHWTHVQDQVL